MIFNLHLDVGRPALCQMEGVGHVFSNHHILKCSGPLPPVLLTSPLIRKEDLKINHCGSCSPQYAKLSYSTLLFFRGRKRNVQRFKTHVHSYCFVH